MFFNKKIRLIVASIGVTLLTGHYAQGYVANGRWSSTATDNPTSLLGRPITLTWSIVPDGTTISNVINGQSGLSDFIGDFDAIYGDPGTGNLEDRSWFSAIQESFDRWEAITGVDFVYEPNDDGLPMGNFGGVLVVRGDIRIGGTTIDGNGGALGQTGFIPNSDITFDTSDVTRWSNTSQNSFNFRHTLMHELGHGIGLDHNESFNASILMEPFAQTGFEGPQIDDIRGAHNLYGDFLEKHSPNGNNNVIDATPLGSVVGGSTVLLGDDAPDSNTLITLDQTDFVSISNIIDVDYFSFEVTEPISFSAVLDPRGPTYNERPNSGSPYTLIDTSSSANLVLELYQVSQGTETLVQSASSGSFGDPEVISDIALTEAGQYALKVSTTTNAVQLYSLELSAESIIEGDYNDDGQVDAADFTIWRDSFQSNDPLLNETESIGVVDVFDYIAWFDNYGNGSAAAASSVPEPNSLLLIGGGLLLAILRKNG